MHPKLIARIIANRTTSAVDMTVGTTRILEDPVVVSKIEIGMTVEFKVRSSSNGYKRRHIGTVVNLGVVCSNGKTKLEVVVNNKIKPIRVPESRLKIVGVIKNTPVKNQRHHDKEEVITCSAIDCKRTRKTHPVNFRGIRNGIPLCQAHYIQKNKVGFTEFSPIRKSGKLQMKYEKRLKTNSHPCECGRPFNSLQSLHSHKTYLSPKYGVPKCNH